MTKTRSTLWPLMTMLLWSGTLPATTSSASALDLDAVIASFEGGWLGEDNDTPMGKMGFVTLFQWEEDGSLHSRSALNRETYIDLRFWKDDDGRWNLTESAGMEGLGVQSHDLVPAGDGSRPGLHRWVHAERPDFLTIDVGVENDAMILDVVLRGEPHAAFRLARQPRETWPEMKRQLELQASQSPAEGTSIHDVVSTPRAAPASAAPDPVAIARQAVALDPEDARARLALAQTLGTAIEENPANGPRYAYEMLSSLTTAIELDPQLAEAYHWLVGYYLNAPPIAGGSVAKAAETAARLAELDPEGARPLLDLIASRQAPPDQAKGDSR